MTNDELDAIEARANAASPAPWTIDYDRGSFVDASGGDVIGDLHVFHGAAGDMNFIADARADVPDLVAEIRRLRSLVERLTIEHRCLYGCGAQLDVQSHSPGCPWLEARNL